MGSASAWKMLLQPPHAVVPRLEEAGSYCRLGGCFGKGLLGEKGSPSPWCLPHTFRSEMKGCLQERGTRAQLARAWFVLHSHFTSRADKWALLWHRELSGFYNRFSLPNSVGDSRWFSTQHPHTAPTHRHQTGAGSKNQQLT